MIKYPFGSDLFLLYSIFVQAGHPVLAASNVNLMIPERDLPEFPNRERIPEKCGDNTTQMKNPASRTDAPPFTASKS